MEKDKGITVFELQTKELKTKRCVLTVTEAG
jgi:hypothetical protein